MNIKNAAIYIIRGDSYYYFSPHNQRRYHYVNFNFLEKKKEWGAKVVTDLGHVARHQVYFQSREDAQNFLNKMLDARPCREDYNLEVVEYRGIYRSNKTTFKATDSIYGKCLIAIDLIRA